MRYPPRLKRAIFSIIAFLPLVALAQSDAAPASAYEKLMRTECDGRVFTKVEVPPVLLGGQLALTDSLLAYFFKRRTRVRGTATFHFVLSKNGEIIDFSRRRGELTNSDVFHDALLKFKHMWTPAVQASRRVCFEIKLGVDFKSEQALLSLEL